MHLSNGVQHVGPGAPHLGPHQQGRGVRDQQGHPGHQQEQQVLQGYGESLREAIRVEKY